MGLEYRSAINETTGITRTGFRICLCQRLKLLRSSIKVPPAFGKPVLGRIKPRPGAHPKQAGIIELLRRNPTDSYLFTGRNGSGKTHLSWALCRAALIRGSRIRGVLLSELISEYRAIELEPKGTLRPAIVPDDLRQGIPYTIFLDEFDKVKTTEFASRKLFELLNAARDFKHQLLITSNKEWDKLRRIWSSADDVYGNSIMTRVSQCNLVEMF